MKRTLHDHALSVVDVLATRRGSNGEIPTITSVEMLSALGHHPKAGKNLGNVISLLDAACLTGNVPWIGRLVLFDNAKEDFVGPWATWVPFKKYIVEHAPRQRRWSDEDIERVCSALPLLPASPKLWWNERLQEGNASLLRALRVVLQQAYDTANAF